MAVVRVDCALGGTIMEWVAMTFPGCLRCLSPDRVSRPGARTRPMWDIEEYMARTEASRRGFGGPRA